jgi:hypothetical protein
MRDLSAACLPAVIPEYFTSVDDLIGQVPLSIGPEVGAREHAP